jgi:hypothetical protein
MNESVLIVLVICVAWVVFSLINMGIVMALKNKGGGIHPFFMFCPIINILSPFICLMVYLDERNKKKN